MAENPLEIVDDVRGIQEELVMRGAEGRRDELCILVLGGGVVEAHCVGVEIGRARVDRGRENRRRIDAARQEHADRNIGDQVRADAVLHGVADPILQRLFGASRGGSRVDGRDVAEASVAREAGGRAPQPRARRQTLHADHPRERRRHRAPREVRHHAGRVDTATDEPCRRERADFRGERQRIAGRGDVQRLDAEAIAGEQQLAFAIVPPRQGEHAAHVRQRIRTVADEQPQQHLGVAAGREPLAAAFERMAKRAVVVDLSVEHDVVTAVGGAHWLCAGWARIDDREAPMNEHDPSIYRTPDAFAVRTSVRERQAQRGRRIAFNRAAVAHEAGNATHEGFRRTWTES